MCRSSSQVCSNMFVLRTNKCWSFAVHRTWRCTPHRSGPLHLIAPTICASEIWTWQFFVLTSGHTRCREWIPNCTKRRTFSQQCSWKHAFPQRDLGVVQRCQNYPNAQIQNPGNMQWYPKPDYRGDAERADVVFRWKNRDRAWVTRKTAKPSSWKVFRFTQNGKGRSHQV